MVVSVRFAEDVISVWNKSALRSDLTTKIRWVHGMALTETFDEPYSLCYSEAMKKILSLSPTTVIEYKDHNASLRDLSSFRNAEPVL